MCPRVYIYIHIPQVKEHNIRKPRVVDPHDSIPCDVFCYSGEIHASDRLKRYEVADEFILMSVPIEIINRNCCIVSLVSATSQPRKVAVGCPRELNGTYNAPTGKSLLPSRRRVRVGGHSGRTAP